VSNVLLLGPGTSRHRIRGGAPFGTVSTEKISVVDYDQKVLDAWPEAELRFFNDLRLPLSLPPSRFDEVHAYEVVNLLGGDDTDFYAFWRAMYNTMKPRAKFYATVPHWKSEFIHAYPRPQRVYTTYLLSYLDRESRVSGKEAFTDLWPEPFCLCTVEAFELSTTSGEPQGFHFALQKPSC
jgi:hypothetical protein